MIIISINYFAYTKDNIFLVGWWCCIEQIKLMINTCEHYHTFKWRKYYGNLQDLSITCALIKNDNVNAVDEVIFMGKCEKCVIDVILKTVKLKGWKLIFC